MNSRCRSLCVTGIFAGLILFSCTREKALPIAEAGPEEPREEARNCMPGMVRILSGHELSQEEISGLAPHYTIMRTFPPAGKFEERHRQAGLHLWYDISFDPSEPLTRASADLSDLLDIRETEFIPVPHAEEFIWPFNDPDSYRLWHYWNDGSVAGEKAGSDIRLLPAWGITTGIPEVIVAVNDTGVEYTHDDLAANMWTNEKELHGKPGVDDDGNGFVDDIYGYNFCYNDAKTAFKGIIEPGDHGTHVAGTIAAVNGNHTGGCGIAGGNGSPGTGVRIMTTQTMSGTSSAANSFVYAADNGALLINCSWSYDRETTPSSYLNAVNYFNTYAGVDENGEQNGLMKGGLIIVSAGNQQKDTACPAMEESVFAVAAVGADYVKGYYSNYGEWVDISAPGGDSKKGYKIYSTITGNTYGTKQGTSMAAPHVTGVAALVISHFGGPGFTREKLIRILQNSADEAIYEHNPDYAGRLGAGLVDAFAALSKGEDPVPSPVTSLSGSAEGRTLTIQWDLPENGFLFNIYYSKESLASLNPENVPEGVNVISMFNPGKKTGEPVSIRIEDLDFSTPYYFRIGTESVSGRKATLSRQIVLTTDPNRKPVITPLDGTSLTLTAQGKGTLRFRIHDPEEQTLSHSLSDMKGVSASRENDMITLVINAPEMEDGKTYDGILSVSDPYDTTEQPFRIEILMNNPPSATGEIDNRILAYGSGIEHIDLRDFFSDPDKDPLDYAIHFGSEARPVRAEVSGNILNIRPVAYGTAPISIVASDFRGKSATISFTVLVRDASRPVDIFPNPVRDILTVRPGMEERIGIRILNASGAVIRSFGPAEAGPFSPLTLDLKSLPPGSYSVVLDGDSVKGTYPVVKL